jgi:hypothetical protein
VKRLDLLVEVTHFTHLTAGGVFFTLADFAGFFVALAAADFGHQAALLAALGKAAERAIKGFPFTDFDEWQ